MCARQDIDACPFHGPIIPRDPVTGAPIQEDTPLELANEDETISVTIPVTANTEVIEPESTTPQKRKTSDKDTTKEHRSSKRRKTS